MNHLPINRAAVAELAAKAKHLGIAPLFFPQFAKRDRHALAALIDPLVQEATDLFEVLSAAEAESFLDALPPQALIVLGRRPTYGTRADRERIALHYLMAEVHAIYFSLRDALEPTPKSSAVLALYPELREQIDDDGLLHVTSGVTLIDTGIRYREHVVLCHPLLRREYSSNPNAELLGLLARYADQTAGKNTFRIAIDHQRIFPVDEYSRIEERDYWFGPPFDPLLLDDRNAVGLTVINRNQSSVFSINGLDRTEFVWTCDDKGVKTFEVEEVEFPSTRKYRPDPFRLNRYVHSQRDTRARKLIHADGAVKVYRDEDYEARFATRLPSAPRSLRRLKLWRVDGDIDVDLWSALVATFYRDNEMVLEYINPAEYEAAFAPAVRGVEPLP
jgi:hypothetical protein